MRHFARPALLLVLASVAVSQEGPDPFLLERVLAPGALAYVSVPQSPAASEDYKKSNLSKLWNHEEIRSFLEPVEKYWKKRKTEPAQVGGEMQPSWNDLVKQTVGLSIDELWDLLGGPLGFAVYDVPLNEEHKLDLVLSLGASDGAKLEKAASSLKDAIKRQGAELTEGEFKHQGATVREFGSAEFRVYYALIERTLVVTTLQDRIQKIITAAADKTFSGLREDAKFKAARAKVAPGNRHFFLGYLNVAGVLQQFRREIGDEVLKVLETLGLADVTSIAGALGYDGGPIRERYALLTARQDRGLLKLLAGGTPVDPAAAQVPAGALAYGHFGLNLAELYDTVLACSKASPDFERQLGEILKGYEQRVGIALRETFGSIGSSWTVVSALPEAGGFFPDDLYIVSLADPAKFEDALEKVAKDAGFPLGEMSFRGQRLRYLTIGLSGAAEGLDLPGVFKFGYAISWFVKDKTLYVSTNPLSLKRHILRLGGRLTPLSEDPRFRSVASKLARGDWESWYYLDTGRWLSAVYNTFEPFVHIVRDFARDPWTGEPIVDAARLPLGETLSDLLGPTLTNKRTLPDAIVMDSLSTSAFSLTSFTGLVAAAAAVAVPGFMAMRGGAGGPAGGIAGNERVAELSLLFIRQAQETFKNSDSDRNGAADYWTRDVAGLYGLKDKSGQAIFLLDPGTAQADPDGAGRYTLAPAPKNGYHFRMMTTDADGEAYQKDDDKDGQSFTNKSRYGVVAYPAAYGATGRFTFLMAEDGKIWKKDTEGQPVTKWPGKDPTKDGWAPAE